MTAEDGIVTYDFVNTFPFWTWVSSWGRDQSYPNGFRYKIFSSRYRSGEGELAIVLEQRGGSKKVMKRLEGDLSAILRTSRTFVKWLEETYGIEFDAFDLSDVKSYEEFERKARSVGWPESEI